MVGGEETRELIAKDNRRMDKNKQQLLEDMAPDGHENILYSRKSAHITPETSVKEFREALERCAFLLATEDIYKFWVGDLLNQGPDIFGDMVYQFTDELLKRYDFETLENYRRVARGIPPDNRQPFDKLSWSCHRDVYSWVDKKEQKEWLARAAQEKWTARRSRKELSDRRKAQIIAEADPYDKPRLIAALRDLNPNVREFQAIANNEIPIDLPKTFEEWIERRQKQDDWEQMSLRMRLKCAFEAGGINAKRNKV
jgi:hypothetical protein